MCIVEFSNAPGFHLHWLDVHLIEGLRMRYAATDALNWWFLEVQVEERGLWRGFKDSEVAHIRRIRDGR